MNITKRDYAIGTFLIALINIVMFLWNLELYIESRKWWNVVAMGFALFAAIVITSLGVGDERGKGL